jgi:hypothetical protein
MVALNLLASSPCFMRLQKAFFRNYLCRPVGVVVKYPKTDKITQTILRCRKYLASVDLQPLFWVSLYFMIDRLSCL